MPDSMGFQCRKFFRRLYTEYFMVSEKLAADRRRSEFFSDIGPTDPASELCQRVKSKKRSETCHIICSGWSVLETHQNIRRGTDCIIGFNFAAFAPLDFDFYFIEGGSLTKTDRLKELTILQEQLIEPAYGVQIREMYLKNTFSWDCDPEYFKHRHRGQLRIIRDVHIPRTKYEQSVLHDAVCADYMTGNNGTYLYGYAATVLALIPIAVHAGFKHVVLHGLDLGGPHFYSREDFEAPPDIAPVLHRVFPPRPLEYIHGTVGPTLRIMPRLSRWAEGNGAKVYSASAKSKIAEVLEVYDPADLVERGQGSAG